mmetsp:Transcript_11611/g.31646  ORF Transcript_11611/g.31646 Transcript_11611/m.31646 type:complete len:343 (+) Transcript_11611:3770-4798(+)
MHQLLAEVHVERPCIRHKGCRHQHISHEPPLHRLHAFDLAVPARVLARQAIDQAVCQLRLAARLLGLCNSSVLVCRGLHQALLKGSDLVLQFLHARTNASQLLIGALQLAVGLRQSRTLWGHNLVDAEVLADVDDPSTQTSSSRRLGADIVGREAGVAHVILLHHGHAVFGGVVLVEVDEGLEEGVYIAHRLFTSSPADVLRHFAAGGGQHHACRHHSHDLCCWGAERFQLSQRRLVQGIQRCLSLCNDRLRCLQVARALLLERLHVCLELAARLLILPAGLHGLIHHGLLLANGNNELVCLLLLLLHHDQVILQRNLQVGHLGTGLRNLVHTVLQAFLCVT